MLIKAGIDSNGTDIAIFNGYLKLQTDNVMYFRNTNTYIYSNADGYLTIYASNGIIMNGDIAVDGDVDFDGGFSCTGDVVDGLIISGTESDNGIEITGVAQGSGIDIDYTIPLTTSYALNIDVDTSIAAGTTWATNQHYTTLAGGASVGTSWFELTMGGNHGSYAICTFARLDYTDAGYTAVGGMGVAGMFEILLPDVAAGGEYHVLALELAENGAGFVSASALGSPTSFIKFECYGDVHDELDDHAYLFYLNGFSAAADHMLSLHSQTLRVDIEEAARYMVLSQMQDGVGLGLTGDHMVLTTAATKAIQIYTTTSVTGASLRICPVEINHARTATAGVTNSRDWGLKVNLTSTHKYGNAANAIYGAMTLVAAGVHGRGAALQGELIMPNAQIIRGTLSCLHLDMTQAANTNSGSSGPVSFISCIGTGTMTDMDARGYLLELTGFTPGNDKLIDDNGADLTADGGIRVLLNGAVKYLLYADSAESA